MQRSIVFTQLTKALLRPIARGGDDVADLHLAVGDEHPIDQQFHERAAPLEGGGGESGAHLGAEGVGAGRQRAKFELLLGDGVQLPLLRGEILLPPGELLPFAFERRQVEHPGHIGVEQALLLPLQFGRRLLHRRLAGL